MSENIHLPESYCNNGLAWVSKPLKIRSLLTLLDGKDTASTHFFFESLREIVVQESGGPRPGTYFTVLEGQGRRRLGRHRLVETSILVRTLVFAKDRNPIPIYLEKERHKGFTGAGQ